MRKLRAIAVGLILLLAGGCAALAQQSAPPPSAQAPSAGDVQELLRILGDPRTVEWLKRSAAAPTTPAAPAPHSLRTEIEARLGAVRARIAELTRAWSNFPLVPHVLAEAWHAELDRGDALRSLTYVIVFIFIGGGLEWLFWQYFHPLLLRISHSAPRTLSRRVGAAAARLLLQVVALAIFAVGSVGTFLSFGWPPFLERLVVNLLLAVIAIRALVMLSRFVLAPRHRPLRMVPLADAMALKIHRWHILVASVFVGAVLIADTLENLAASAESFPQAANAALAVSVGLGALAVAALVAMIWSIWHALALGRGARPGSAGRFDPVLLKILPIIQTTVLVTAFVLWTFGATELMWTILVLGTFIPASRLLRAIVNHLFDEAEQGALQGAEERSFAPAAPHLSSVGDGRVVPEGAPESAATVAEPSDQLVQAQADEKARIERLETYRPIARRLARFALAAIALAILAGAWGANILALSSSPSLAGRMVKVAIDIVAVLLIADLAWTWARTAIDRRLANYVAPPPGEAPGPEARMATLLPLLRNILLVSVLALVALTILSSLGINVAPLIAGAGIVGVAIGFGAQSLVRDIVSGIFFLVDDAFRVGEYIEIGDLRGTVESMSLRSMRVRHHRGMVHTIPFGELKALTNYSRDWVIMKLEFRVPFETDLRLVKKLVKQVGAELQADPNYGAQIIEPLKSQGVRRMEEFNMVVGVKFMARPGAQWVIRRDAYHKLRDAFDRAGISFAQRNVKVEVLSDKPLPEDVMKAVTGAAQAAVEERRQAQPAADEP